MENDKENDEKDKEKDTMEKDTMKSDTMDKDKKEKDAETLDEFHLFTKFPTELQDMVWECYRDGLDPTCHCFSITASQIRRYTAVNPKKWEMVNSISKERPADEDMLPNDSLIRFDGEVTVIGLGKTGSVSQLFANGPYHHTVSAAFVRADPKRDLFFFNYTRYRGRHEWFRFVRNPIKGIQPPKLPEDHWIRSVRNVALLVPFKIGSLSDCDRAVLSQMKHLQQVYLVMRQPDFFRKQFFYVDRWLAARPRIASAGEHEDLFWVEDDYATEYANLLRKVLEVAADRIGALLERHGIRARITAAIENCDEPARKLISEPASTS
ncbi:hypothetical protein GGR52DRAFT_214001 [Hypoxylon sp. FL1284]|nr:hypothetical protein GGR52DRAFT_214001 [Hypoxylon sp. FL1284]